MNTTRPWTRWIVGLIATALVVGGWVAPAHAASQTVTITSSGFVPKDVTVQVGDSVTFANTDSAAHQVEFRGGNGITCSANPLVIQAGQSGSCTFASAGNFAYSDPNKKGNTFKGSVTAAAPSSNGAVTLTASTALVVYGAKVTLSGKVAPAKGSVTVDLWARPYPEPNFAKVASAVTTGDGSFTFSLPPQIRTEYRAQFADGSVRGESAIATVRVRPRVTLSVRKVVGSKVSLRTGVVSTLSYSGTSVLVQRRNSQGGWTTVRTVRLGQFSTATFTAPAPRGTTRWRVYLQAAKAGGGYEASFSPTRRVVR